MDSALTDDSRNIINQFHILNNIEEIKKRPET